MALGQVRGYVKRKTYSMKIFLSYGHDSNTPLIEKIKDYLSKDAEGTLRLVRDKYM